MASAVLACAAVRSVGSGVPAPAARPLNVAAAMFASFAFVTASSAICAEPTWLRVARAPSPLTSDAADGQRRFRLRRAQVGGVAGSGAGRPTPERGRCHVRELHVGHRIIGDLRGSDLAERRQGARIGYVG